MGKPLDQSRGLALGVLCAATLMVILDGTIVTVALPSIQRSLGFSPAGLTWVMNAYLIAFGGTLLLAGKTGDRLGRRRVLLAGLVVFAVASLACGFCTAPEMLITARFAQGIGGAMVTAVSLGMIVALYEEPGARARAVGAYSFVGAAGASVGLVLGGILTQQLGWHWVFFVNVPIAALAGALAVRVLAPDHAPARGGGVDVAGAILVTSGLMTGVLSVVGTAGYGWTSAHTLVLAAIAAVLLAGFAVRQATTAEPLIPLRIFAAREVTGANLAQFLVIAAAFGFQVLITLYMQRVLGYSAEASGLGLIPVAAVIAGVSLGLSARLSSRFGARAVLLAGLSLILAALAILTRIPVHGHYLTDLLPALIVFGVGAGLTLPALTTLGMSAATPADAGLVSGVFNTSQQAGAAIGVALLSSLAAARTARLLAAHQSPVLAAGYRVALTAGYRLAFVAGAAACAAALLLAATVLAGAGLAASPRRRGPRATRAARPAPATRPGTTRSRRHPVVPGASRRP